MAENKSIKQQDSKSFLGGLFRSISKGNAPSGVTSQHSDLQPVGTLPPEVTASRILEDEAKYVKLLESYHAKKANQLDAIFARTAQRIADLPEQGEEEESHLIDTLAPFPEDLPLVYKVLISRLENDKYFDRLIPFTLRRLHELGKANQFIDYIYHRIQARDQQIEEICAVNAIILTESTQAFVDVNIRADALRTSVVTVDDREVYEAQLKKVKFAGKATRTTSNILFNVAQLMTRICALRPTLQHFEEARPFADAGQPVKALRKLYQAEASSAHLPSQLTFVKWLVSAIPDMKQRLVAEALQGVTRTLENLRSQNIQVGFSTFRNVCQTRRIFLPPYYVKDGDRRSIANDLDTNSIQQALSLRPLLHYRHVLRNLIEEDSHGSWGSGYLFDYYLSYMAERQNQILSKLQAVEQLHTVESVRLFLQNIVGVFATELYISHVIPGISSQLYYDEMWKEASQVTVESLDGSIRVIQDEATYRDTQNILHLFCETLRMLRCDPTGIRVIAGKFGFYYCDVLLDNIAVRLEQAVNADSSKCLVVSNEDEKTAVTDILDYWWEEPVTTFPRTLPFSSSVPRTVDLIKNYISGLVGVWRDIPLEPEDAREQTFSLTKYFLEHDVRKLLSKVLSSGTPKPVEYYVQFHCNCFFLEEAVPSLERYISSQLRIGNEGVTLDCRHVFSLLRTEAEIHLFKGLTVHIEAVVKSYRLDSANKQLKATGESQRIIEYVNQFMETGAALPDHILQKVWAISSTTISTAIQQYILQDCKSVTVEGLLQLKLDTEQYELTLARHGEYASDPAALTDAFATLRQLIDVISNDDWVNYFAGYGGVDFRYDRVTPEIAWKALSKLKEPDEKGSNMLISLKTGRERNKKRKALLAQLAGLGGNRFLATAPSRTASIVQSTRSLFS